MITPGQIQSLIASNASEIRRVLKEIETTASMLAPAKYRADGYNQPFYAILSKLQRKRAKLEALQRGLRSELKLLLVRENARKVLEAAGFRSTNEQILYVAHTEYPRTA